MRCKEETIRSEFDSKEACVAANTIQVVKDVPRETIEFQNALIQREDALRGDLQDDLDTLRQTIDELKESRQRPVTRPAQQIQQTPFLDSDRRARLAAIKGDE